MAVIHSAIFDNPLLLFHGMHDSPITRAFITSMYITRDLSILCQLLLTAHRQSKHSGKRC